MRRRKRGRLRQARGRAEAEHHPIAAHLTQEARIVAQSAGHKPDVNRVYAAPPVFLYEPHQPEQCNFKAQVILNIDEVWETKRKAFEVLAAREPALARAVLTDLGRVLSRRLRAAS